jgi:hypothetical protein
MKHGIIIIVLFISAITAAFAQPKGEIYYKDEAGNLSDTIDFDVVFYKNTTPIIRNVTLDNSGNSSLQIADSKAPYYVVKKINPATLEYTEFNSYLLSFPYSVNSSQKKSFALSYIPRDDISPSQYPLGNRVALLQLALTVQGDTSIIAKKDFLLSVLKTKDFLASRREMVDFDSVYVGVILPVERDWLVKNTTEKEVIVANQKITPLVTRFNEEFQIQPISFPFRFIGLTSKPFSIQYKPIDLGEYRAQYSIFYSPNIDNQPDSATVVLRGVGVRQMIDIDNQTSASPSPANATVISANQVAISNNIPANDSIVLSLVIRNNGNIPFGLVSQRLEGDTQNFYILKKFRDDHNLRPKSSDKSGELDTAIIIFKSKDLGNYSVQYVLGSDIRSRIASAPDSTKEHRITIFARAAKPNLVILNAPNSILNFGSLFFPKDNSCAAPRRTITLQMRNSGNAPLKINSATIRPSDVFSTSAPDAEIPANQERTVEVVFAPNSVGEFNAELLIATNTNTNPNEPSDTIRIQLTGKAVQPPEVSFSFPQRITARAGRQIAVPLFVSKSIGFVSKVEVSVVFDTLGLEFARYNTLGTSADGAEVLPSIRGNTIKLTITAPDRNFYDRDTLIFLIFNTYLSRVSPSSLVLNVKAGTPNCAEVFPVDSIKNGIFTLDSVSLCGQAFQVILGAGSPFQLKAIAPNPSDEFAWVEYSLPYSTETSVKIFTTFGSEVRTIAHGVIESGTYQAAIPVAGLSPGMYYCVMQSGLFRAVQPIVVAR